MLDVELLKLGKRYHTSVSDKMFKMDIKVISRNKKWEKSDKTKSFKFLKKE